MFIEILSCPGHYASRQSDLIKQAGLARAKAQTGAVTLIQRFGSAPEPTVAVPHGLVDTSTFINRWAGDAR